jgi:L-ascorbate metabolism protein UlaG (beta-lactamase superfamily)
VTGSLTFLGNATTLVRYGGFTVLTDPNFLHDDHFDRIAVASGG